MTEPIVNDLTIQAATVNGSGSQTANLVLTRAIFHMGIPVAPKNVFPSNIEGLPTWYQLRITPEGHMARSDKVDILIAFNVATWHEDLKSVRAGGVVIHEQAFSTADVRTDVTYYPVPFAKLAKAKIQSDTLRKQLANMIYVGVVGGLLGIPWEALEHGVKRQFLAKPKAVPVNLDAIKVGYDYWQDNFSKQDPYRLEPMTGVVEGKVLVEGNQAAAIGALMGGVTVVAWYPITPSSSLCEYLIAYADRFRIDEKAGEKRISVVQAEDELAAVGMAIGAGWAGARAMTSTSGPGISLMAEFSGLAYYAEVPVVIFDIQRIGPSTGLPTRTSQADIGFVYTLSHGDTKHIVLLPGTVEECYEFARDAFDYADRFQTPVFVLSDLDLGMNLWMTPEFKYPEKSFDRGKVLSKEDLFSEDHTAEVLAVESVFSAYTFANDSHNGPLAASLFTDDAIIHFVWNNHGTLVPTFGINPRQTPDGMLGEGCVLTGHADIAQYFGYNRTANLRPQDKDGLALPWPGHHIATNKMVKVADDGQSAMLTTTWITATSQPREGAPNADSARITGTGMYRIFFRKTPKAWLISEFYGVSERPSTTNQCDLKGPLPRPTK